MRKTYHHVIVGGGTAGSILANRLLTRGGNQVPLCETGEDTPGGRVPGPLLNSRSGFASCDTRSRRNEPRYEEERTTR